jgi:hypothetical protein
MTTTKKTTRALEIMRAGLEDPRLTRLDLVSRAITDLRAIKTGRTPPVTYAMFAALIGVRDPGQTMTVAMVVETIRIIEAVKAADRALNDGALTLPYDRILERLP